MEFIDKSIFHRFHSYDFLIRNKFDLWRLIHGISFIFHMMIPSHEFFLTLLMKEEFLWIFSIRIGIWFHMDILILFMNHFSLIKACFNENLLSIFDFTNLVLNGFPPYLPSSPACKVLMIKGEKLMESITLMLITFDIKNFWMLPCNDAILIG